MLQSLWFKAQRVAVFAHEKSPARDVSGGIYRCRFPLRAKNTFLRESVSNYMRLGQDELLGKSCLGTSVELC